MHVLDNIDSIVIVFLGEFVIFQPWSVQGLPQYYAQIRKTETFHGQMLLLYAQQQGIGHIVSQ